MHSQSFSLVPEYNSASLLLGTSMIFHWLENIFGREGATFTCLYITMLFIMMAYCDCKILELI